MTREKWIFLSGNVAGISCALIGFGVALGSGAMLGLGAALFSGSYMIDPRNPHSYVARKMGDGSPK